jgi:hypothetical protein
VQESLRQAFGRWGRPQRFRVDNGMPWGSWSDLPTDLALWLIGLDIAMIWNRPRTPQENGVVERSQGTGKRWAEPRACRSVEELQARLTVMDHIQREEYPIPGAASRLERFPELRHSRRPYTKAWEKANWNLDQAMAHLTEYTVTRRVDKTGQVSMYNRNLYVGVMHAGKTVFLMYDPEQREWVIADSDQNELRRKPAPYLTRESILTLAVTQRETKH